MKILVRLPNWLGDMVMAVGALQQLPLLFPGAAVSVIAKKGIHELLPFFPPVADRFVFDKEAFGGPRGLWRFGRQIRAAGRFDLFVSLPDSFSSALMGFATGAERRIGYRNEARNLLLTQAFPKPQGRHRVEEYAQLPALFAGRDGLPLNVRLHHTFSKNGSLVVNINSEASSRRLTKAKAVELIDAVRETFDEKIVLVGGRNEAPFVQAVFNALKTREGIEMAAGKTSLTNLVEILASAGAVLTTDSGPAHLANALGTQTVVLFGAGNEANTAPYNRENRHVIRLGKLGCEPCTKNTCVRYATPQCLEQLETAGIILALKQKRVEA